MKHCGYIFYIFYIIFDANLLRSVYNGAHFILFGLRLCKINTTLESISTGIKQIKFTMNGTMHHPRNNKLSYLSQEKKKNFRKKKNLFSIFHVYAKKYFIPHHENSAMTLSYFSHNARRELAAVFFNVTSNAIYFKVLSFIVTTTTMRDLWGRADAYFLHFFAIIVYVFIAFRGYDGCAEFLCMTYFYGGWVRFRGVGKNYILFFFFFLE